MQTKSDLAVAKFTEGYNCTQSVFYAFCDDLPFDKETALKIACGFGAGMGRKQQVCGATSGGIMVIGARYGRGDKDELDTMELTYTKVRELINRFAERHGSVICRELLSGCELLTEAGQAYFRENDLKEKICIPCIQSVVEIIEKLI